MTTNRRHFLGVAGLAAVAGLSRQTKAVEEPVKPIRKPKFELAVASYTCREFDLAKTIEMTQRVGLKSLSMKSMHLPLNWDAGQIKAALQAIAKAGIGVYAGGVIYMKTREQVQQAFDYAKTAGMEIIVGVPNHELLDMTNQKVKEYNIKVAIHNHGPGDLLYPTPESVIEKISKLDERIGLCMDIGHTQRSGIDPADDIIRFKERMIDLHLKDVSKAEKSGSTVEMGRGVINIPKMVEALYKINYSGKGAFEYEKDGKDPLPGLAESVGYMRGVIAGLA